jgi:hypothetical protein
MRKIIFALQNNDAAGSATAFGSAGVHPVNALRLKGLQNRLSGRHVYLHSRHILYRQNRAHSLPLPGTKPLQWSTNITTSG